MPVPPSSGQRAALELRVGTPCGWCQHTKGRPDSREPERPVTYQLTEIRRRIMPTYSHAQSAPPQLRPGRRSTRRQIVRLHYRGTGGHLHGVRHLSMSQYIDRMPSGPDLVVDHRRMADEDPVDVDRAVHLFPLGDVNADESAGSCDHSLEFQFRPG